MANVELVPFTGMTTAELRTFAAETHERVRDNVVRDHLGSLMLYGAVRRHNVSAAHSYEGMRTVQEKMAAGEMAAFGVRATSFADQVAGTEYVGTATLQPGLELRTQSLSIPPPIARRVVKLAPFLAPVISHPVNMSGPNAVAWVDPRITGSDEITAGAQHALLLQTEAGREAWRLIPEAVATAGHCPMDTIMRDADFRPQGDGTGQYYDDQEVGVRQLLPASILYTAQTIGPAAETS